MSKKHAVIYVLNNRSWVGTANDMEEVNEVLAEVTQGDKDFNFRNIKLLNVIDEMTGLGDVATYTPGEINLEDLNEGGDELTIKITSGYFNGSVFHDEEDFREFLTNKIKEGELNIEDVKHMDIVQERVNGVDFGDAWIDDGVWRIDIDKVTDEPATEALYNRMGAEFEPTNSDSERQKYIEDQIDKQLRARIEGTSIMSMDFNPEEMSDERLTDEITKLQERLFDLRWEQKRRTTSISE